MRLIVILAAGLAWATSPAVAQPAIPAPVTPAPPALTQDQARTVLDVLQDDKRRAAFTAVLQDMIKALPAAVHDTPVALVPHSVGAQLLTGVSGTVRGLAVQMASATTILSAVPGAGTSLAAAITDPSTRERIGFALWRLSVVLASAGLVEWLLARLLRRPLRALGNAVPAEAARRQHPATGTAEPAAHEPHTRVAFHMLRRLPFVLLEFLLDVLPALAFALTGYALLGTPLGATTNVRLVVIAVVNAYVLCRIALCVTRAFVSPDDHRLRLVVCSDEAAAYVTRWMRRLVVVIATGFALAEVGLLFGLSHAAYDMVLKLFALVIHGMLIVIVLQTRHAVARRLRARKGAVGTLANWQNYFAASWHLVAMFLIVALWLVAAAKIEDSYSRLLHSMLVTAAVLIPSRLVMIVLLGGLDRLAVLGPAAAERYPQLAPRLQRYRPMMRAALMTVIWLLTGVTLLEIWGLGAFKWFGTGRLGQQLLSATGTSVVTVVVALLVWEVANAGVDEHLAALTRQAQIARVTRLRTLLPILRTTLLVVILLIAGLIVLSEVGVNVAPLLAGAGVLGVAIGFGSQKLVQDLITGLFLLLENTMQVGDVVTLGGQTGTVETLSIRTIRLRALDGAVHIIPFSAVTTVTNQTRDFSYALIDLAVGLNEEPDHVMDVVQDIVAGMRAEPRWSDAITAELEVMGVHAFADNAWTLRLRIRTEPTMRGAVNREFNRRVKHRFDELAIQSPLTAYRVQGWMPPGAERPIPHPQETQPS